MSKLQDTPTATPPALLTTSEAAAYLNIQPATMEQHRWNGRGPSFVKIGRSVRYRQADLDTFLAERVFSSTTEAQAAELQDMKTVLKTADNLPPKTKLRKRVR